LFEKQKGEDMRAKNIKKGIVSIVSCLVLTAALTFPALAAAPMLIPVGRTVGISLSAEGIVVVGIPEKMKDGVGQSPAKAAGIKAGDVIKRIDSKSITSKEDLKTATEGLDGSVVTIEVVRGKQTLKLKLTPYKYEDGTCELGLWMRDGIAGIGTMTFYDPETGVFGALGHSINDSESGVQMPLEKGVITRASVSDVTKGKPGAPGQLVGSFDFDDVLGTVTCNASCGIFGFLENTDIIGEHEAMPVAAADEIRTGPAVILTNVSGNDIGEYTIEISRVYNEDDADGRNIMITVTDRKLIEKTGGIVQGMSGSPIIQDGKLVGAVTHVLINDPERGFGVSVEKMLETALGKPLPKTA